MTATCLLAWSVNENASPMLVKADHLAACPPQWLPVLLASSSQEALSTMPSNSPNPPPSTPPAPPCTVEMLKQRPAGDKSWPIACSDTTLGEANKDLDLRGAHLSYGDFKDATFMGEGEIKLNGAGLANADLSGSKITADTFSGPALIDFSGANLTNADLSGSEVTADTSIGDATIDVRGANLAGANLSGSEVTATAGSFSEAIINFTEANLAGADLSGSKVTATTGGSYGEAIIDFTNANLTNADLRGVELSAKGIIGLAPPPSGPPQPCLECKDECSNSFDTCTKSTRKCKRKRNRCNKKCKKSDKCGTSCEDNTIPGIGSFWCNLNTNTEYVTGSVKEEFCKTEIYKNNCMLSCGECTP